MPIVLTGANLANRDLLYLGVSGDGDSASIGLGQFAHAMRRGVRMAYIVENNGVYGLTKGQFSATADQGSKSKKGVGQHRQPGRPGRRWRCSWAPPTSARGFSGNKAQLVPLIKGAISARRRGLHRRASAPAWPSTTTRAAPRATTTCASTTRRSAASTSSARATRSPSTCAPGEVVDVRQHDGTLLRLRSLHAGLRPRPTATPPWPTCSSTRRRARS